MSKKPARFMERLKKNTEHQKRRAVSPVPSSITTHNRMKASGKPNCDISAAPSKDNSSSSDKIWACGSCTFHNPLVHKTCYMCKQRRPSENISSQSPSVSSRKSSKQQNRRQQSKANTPAIRKYKNGERTPGTKRQAQNCTSTENRKRKNVLASKQPKKRLSSEKTNRHDPNLASKELAKIALPPTPVTAPETRNKPKKVALQAPEPTRTGTRVSRKASFSKTAVSNTPRSRDDAATNVSAATNTTASAESKIKKTEEKANNDTVESKWSMIINLVTNQAEAIKEQKKALEEAQEKTIILEKQQCAIKEILCSLEPQRMRALREQQLPTSHALSTPSHDQSKPSVVQPTVDKPLTRSSSERENWICQPVNHTETKISNPVTQPRHAETGKTVRSPILADDSFSIASTQTMDPSQIPFRPPPRRITMESTLNKAAISSNADGRTRNTKSETQDKITNGGTPSQRRTTPKARDKQASETSTPDSLKEPLVAKDSLTHHLPREDLLTEKIQLSCGDDSLVSTQTMDPSQTVVALQGAYSGHKKGATVADGDRQTTASESVAAPKPRAWITNDNTRTFLHDLNHGCNPADQRSPVEAKTLGFEANVKLKTKDALWDEESQARGCGSGKGVYKETVRCREKRRGMPCHDCTECRRFLDILKEQGHEFSQEPVKYSRHRSYAPDPETPADFWELDFIDEKRARENISGSHNT